MKKENKCFFSISLENGITLTGNNPIEIELFLYEMHSAFYELGERYKQKKLDILSTEAFTTMKQIGNAIKTIDNNYKIKKGRTKK